MNEQLSQLDDVISVEQNKPFGMKTFTVAEFFDRLDRDASNLPRAWETEGIPCRHLSPGGKWREGTIKLTLSFTPGEVSHE